MMDDIAEPNIIGGSMEAPGGTYGPKRPLIGWDVIHACILTDRYEYPVFEVHDGTSVSPARRHLLIMN